MKKPKLTIELNRENTELFPAPELLNAFSDCLQYEIENWRSDFDVEIIWGDRDFILNCEVDLISAARFCIESLNVDYLNFLIKKIQKNNEHIELIETDIDYIHDLIVEQKVFTLETGKKIEISRVNPENKKERKLTSDEMYDVTDAVLSRPDLIVVFTHDFVEFVIKHTRLIILDFENEVARNEEES